MVGKLFLNLDDDYEYDIRRARQVAEGLALAPEGAGEVIDGTVVPAQTISAWTMQWKADGVAKSVTTTDPVVTTSRATVLAELAALGEADASVGTGLSTDSFVVLVPQGLVVLSGGIIVRGPAAAGLPPPPPPPPPDDDEDDEDDD